MSKAKFTKREWAVITEPESEHYLTTVDCGGVMQLNVITSATDITFAESFERRANAHLIVAAPDMYKEIEDDIKNLKSLLMGVDPSSLESAAIEKKIHRKQKLLVKARGEHD